MSLAVGHRAPILSNASFYHPTTAEIAAIFDLDGLDVQYAKPYTIQDTFIGAGFFDGWKWESFDDPTHGRVNYVDKETAIRTNLSYAVGTKFFMRVDSANVVKPGSRGRDSVRISSYTTFDEGVVVLDVEHMPTGCGTWPAFWTLSKAGPWPKGGEIDIIEGVNNDRTNLASLHTTPYCDMPHVREQTGATVSTMCDTNLNFNQGCGTRFQSPNSYGKGLNDIHGGWYVMHKSPHTGVKVWFWPRSSPWVPFDVRIGSAWVKPSEGWGTPDAYFPLKGCDYSRHFDAHQMVFDTTFCGDWGGNDWYSSSCGPMACADFVDTQPLAFTEAYWEINSLRVYT